MMDQISKPIRQIVAVGLLAALVFALVGFVITPLWQHLEEVQDRIYTERQVLGRLSTTIAREAELGRGRDPAADSGAFLKGESEAIQLAELQALLKEIVAAQGLRLLSLRTLPPVDRDRLHLVGVRADLNGSAAAVQKLLHTIETTRPLLLVDFVEIQLVSAARAEAAKTDLLVVGFNVYGAVTRRKG